MPFGLVSRTYGAVSLKQEPMAHETFETFLLIFRVPHFFVLECFLLEVCRDILVALVALHI